MRRVLFVEDSDEARELYGAVIRREGLHVDEAANLGAAMDATAGGLPDLLLLDRDLPDGDGFELARQLKSGERTRSIPILAFTSHTMKRDVMAARSAGCDGFLAKPTTPANLVAELKRLLGVVDHAAAG